MRPIPILIILFLIAAISLTLSCSRDRDSADTGDVVFGDIGAGVDDYLSRLVPFGFSGAALVARGDSVLLNKGYGLAIADDSTLNNSATVFSTGSITKQFTAAAIMKLDMMGKLSTDDLIGKYFENVPPDKENIRLHHLLTHTAGLPDGVGYDFEAAGREEIMNRILQAPLEFTPGDEFGYSNCGYSMLAAIIEKTSGMTYEEFLHQHLFEPSGMKFTGYRLPEWSKRTVAHWYAGDIDNGTPLEKDYPYWNYIGNGGILSTTDDMLRWHRALMGSAVLSDEAKTKLYTPFLNDYAYGWDVFHTERGTLIQHDGGSTLGCAADYKRFVDSNSVIMLFSNRSGSDMLMDKGVRDKVVELIFDGDLEMPLNPVASDIDLSTLQGNYLLDDENGYLVTATARNLQLVPFGDRAITTLYITSDSLTKVVAENARRSKEVLSAAVEDNFEPLRRLINDDQRLERIKQLWYMRVGHYAEMTGPLVDAVVRFSWPSGYEAGATETIMEIEGQQGSFFFKMIWKDGKMIGIGPTQPPNVGLRSLLSLGANRFFTYDISAARNIQMTFEGDSLIIAGEDGAVAATRGQ